MLHTPVFLPETIEALQIIPEGKYVDATAGEGGHSSAIAQAGGNVLSLDWDNEQIKKLQKTYEDRKNIHFVHGNFAHIQQLVEEQNFGPVDGILFDFGLSMRQISDGGRGFSYNKPEDPLDMRIGQDNEQTVQNLVNYASANELYEIIATNSEELHSRAIAEALVSTRKVQPLKKVQDLLDVINNVLTNCQGKHNHNKQPAYSRVFQALRIAVNEEFINIEEGLQGAVNILKPEGKIVIITFHSLEDRIVKRFAKKHANLHMKKIDVEKKRRLYPFERSATLRVITFNNQ